MVRFHHGYASIGKVRLEMMKACVDCGANLDVPNDPLIGEIIGCPD